MAPRFHAWRRYDENTKPVGGIVNGIDGKLISIKDTGRIWILGREEVNEPYFSAEKKGPDPLEFSVIHDVWAVGWRKASVRRLIPLGLASLGPDALDSRRLAIC